MKDFNKMATELEWNGFTSRRLKRKAPLVYMYGRTGSGKTYAQGKLINHVLEDGTRPYAPVHYIDIDGGAETVGAAAENEELCTLRPYDDAYGDELLWAFDELRKAETVECGAIIFEGSSAIFAAMLLPEMEAIERSSKGEAWQAHNEPSRKISTLWEAIKRLKVNRNHAGIGVPIFVTLNCREVGEQGAKYYVPNFSVNVTNAAMRTADAFLELQRETSTKWLTLPCSQNKYRKLRREAVAVQVQKAWNLGIPGLLTMWAYEAAKDRQKLTKDMQAHFDAAADATPETQPETSEAKS